MAEAIGDDETREKAVARFVGETEFPPDGIKASRLHDMFITFAECAKITLTPMSAVAFSKAIEAAGVEKKRTKHGIHYLGLKQAEAAQ